jgi:hypothetical protein
MNIGIKYTNIFAAIAILFLFTKCGPTVQTNKTANVNLEKFDTYAYLPTPDTVKYMRLSEEMVEEKTMEAVNNEMQEAGYTINRDNPDLLVKTHVMVDREVETVADPVYSTYDYYYPGFTVGYPSPYYYSGYNTVPQVVGYDVDAIPYTEGTIVVDIINAKTNEIVWRGWAEETISADNFEDDLKEYVDEIFEEYPVEDA